jgi:hypothetical protein
MVLTTSGIACPQGLLPERESREIPTLWRCKSLAATDGQQASQLCERSPRPLSDLARAAML